MDFSVKLPLAGNRNAEQYRCCTLICGNTSGLTTHYNKIQAKQTEIISLEDDSYESIKESPKRGYANWLILNLGKL